MLILTFPLTLFLSKQRYFGTVATACLLIAFSVEKSLWSLWDLICLNSAVVISMCKLRGTLQAVSSNSCMIAVLRWATFPKRSLSPHTFSSKVIAKKRRTQSHTVGWCCWHHSHLSIIWSQQHLVYNYAAQGFFCWKTQGLWSIVHII